MITAHQEKMKNKFIEWGTEQPLVRAMILTSTLAIPGGLSDVLSDFDIILALQDVHPFYESRNWLKAFGHVLALYRDPLETEDVHLKSGYVIQFEKGLKIDFTLWEVQILQKIVAAPELDLELDAGYQVLLDKDHLTKGLKPPSFRAYIPKPPSEVEYQETIEVFFLDTTYVAKFLWRDDLVAAKHIQELLVQEHLLPMLEWHLEIEHGWSIKPGPYGRRLKQWLRLDLWKDLESTYTGADLEDNWDALFQTIALMRKTAVEVGEKFGFAYPNELENRVMEHLKKVKNLDRKAKRKNPESVR
jgi:aminoglycoside 6-adenylyltransferase